MHALADCVKVQQGMTSSARNSQAAQDLQQIIEATKAHVQAQPDRFEDVATPSATPNIQQVPRVQTPNMPRVLRVQALPSVPATHTDDNKRITRSMLAQPSVPRVHSNVTPTIMPTDSAKQECIKKRQAARLGNAATPTSTSPRARTRAHVATAAARVTPPSMSTRSRARQSNAPPPSRQPGFPAAVRRQQRHQHGMVRLSQRITRLENEVNQAMAVMDTNTGKLLNYRQLTRSIKYREAWILSSANKFGRLANGIAGRIKNPTNTIEFIFQNDVPTERMKDVTYGKFVCTVQPEKAEPNQIRFTVGGDRINYPGTVATPTVKMLVAKMLFNSVISTKDAHFMTMDISNFYLMTPLHCPEIIRMKLSNIPDEVLIEEYKLREKATKNGSIYIKAKQGMYGLPQSGLLANELLEKCLNKHGYRQSKLVPSLWKHDTWPIQFTLVVDDFEVKYVGKEHAQHLKNTLEQHYKLTCDWTGTRYIGITLDWDYNKRQVHLSMPNYVKKALKQFQRIVGKLQHSPYPSVRIQ
jgi:hypothetical protein